MRTGGGAHGPAGAMHSHMLAGEVTREAPVRGRSARQGFGYSSNPLKRPGEQYEEGSGPSQRVHTAMAPHPDIPAPSAGGT